MPSISESVTPRESFEIDEPMLPGDKLHSPRLIQHRAYRKSNVFRRFKYILAAVASAGAIVFIILLGIYFSKNSQAPSRDASAAAHTGSFYESGFNMKQNWGAYSPYFDTGVPFNGISRKALDGVDTLPNGCAYKQVHLLHRHGNRYPAEGTARRMEAIADRLMELKQHELPKSMSWIKEWEYRLGDEYLVGSGVGALFDSGSRFWGSHGRLLYGNESANLAFWSDDVNVWPNGTHRAKPLIRATTQQRIQDSARAWAAGFFGTYGFPSTGVNPLDHYDLLLMEEAMGNNNSMAGYYACPNADDKKAHHHGKKLSEEWTETYLQDAVARLQRVIPAIGNLTADEVLAIQDLCVFETAAFDSSPFCSLFTEQEWRGFEYHTDLKFYGEAAWGSPVGPATGLPWLTELRAFLTYELITEATNGVNVTLDSATKTFPIHQPFTADFTHDTTIMSVLAALQFPFTMTELSPHEIKVPRQMIVSRLTPFAARLYVEVIERKSGVDRENFVRLRLNDRVLPIGDLKYCDDDDKMGWCPLESFVKHLDWALKKIKFEKVCYEDTKLD